MDQARWMEIHDHRDRLLRVAMRHGMSPDDARDVVQEAMLRCAEFDHLDMRRLGAFLTTVTVRLCADVHRRSSEPARARRWLAPLMHHEPDPADVVCRDEGAVWVASLVDRLPERQRHVILDRAHGLSIEQIASRHSLTYKAAESALSRARAALRAAVTASLSATALAALARRAKISAVPIATASVAAIVGVTAVVVTPHAPEGRDTRARPGAPPAVVDLVRRPDAGATAPREPGGQPTGRPSTTPTPTRGPRHAAPSAPTTRSDPLPTFSFGNGEQGVEHQDNGYGPKEEIENCLRYGLETYPDFQCRTPPPSPTPDPRPGGPA